MTTLSARLRRERERRGITLNDIASTTKISASLFEGLERGDVSRWPAGIFRRSFIRAYATAIGLDPEAVCREFTDQFPETEGERRPTLSQPDRPPRRESGPFALDHKSASALRLTLADAGGSFIVWSLLRVPWHRWAAVACDAGAVAALATAAYLVAGQFWMSLALSAVLYYGGSVLLLGSTPGVSWFLTRSGETSAEPAHVAIRPHAVDARRHGDAPVLAEPVTTPKLHRLVRFERRRRAGA